MKILQAVGWFYPDSWGGTEIYVAGLAHRLRAAGHDVTIAAPDPAHRDERYYVHEGLPVYRYPIPDHPTREEAQGAVVARGAEAFHRRLAALEPDIVHFHTFVSGLGIHEAEAARAAGARVIVTTHAASLGYLCARGTMMRWGASLCDSVPDEATCTACMLQSRGIPRRLAVSMARLPGEISQVAARWPGRAGTAFGMGKFIHDQRDRQRRLFDAVDRFVVLTSWASEALIANGAPRKKLSVNRLGLAHRHPARKPGPDVHQTSLPVRFGYIGRFDPIKGLADLVRALASLPAGCDFQAELRGPLFGPAEREHVAELRALAGSDRRILISDGLPHAEVPRALAGLDVLCCPSLTPEGGPTVAIEAHAVGTPVIGTRIGGLSELVTDGVNGRLVAPGDWRALAEVVRSIVADPRGTVDQWRRALPRARTLDDVTRDYLELYAA
jgi:glycosyltransferase involved in cell wall biosynthesis